MITVPPNKKMFWISGFILMLLGGYLILAPFCVEPDWTNREKWPFIGLLLFFGLCLVVPGVLILRALHKGLRITWDGHELVVRGIFKTNRLSLDEIRHIEWPCSNNPGVCMIQGENKKIAIIFSWWDRHGDQFVHLLLALHEAVSFDVQSHWKEFCLCVEHLPELRIPGKREPDASRGETLRTRKYFNRITLILFGLSLILSIGLCLWFSQQVKINAPDEPVYWWHYALIVLICIGTSIMFPLPFRLTTPPNGQIIKPEHPALVRHSRHAVMAFLCSIAGGFVLAWLLNGFCDNQTPNGVTIIVLGMAAYIVGASVIFVVWMVRKRNKIICNLAAQLPDDCIPTAFQRSQE